MCSKGASDCLLIRIDIARAPRKYQKRRDPNVDLAAFQLPGRCESRFDLQLCYALGLYLHSSEPSVHVHSDRSWRSELHRATYCSLHSFGRSFPGYLATCRVSTSTQTCRHRTYPVLLRMRVARVLRQQCGFQRAPSAPSCGGVLGDCTTYSRPR
jgi:hypothetical protein